MSEAFLQAERTLANAAEAYLIEVDLAGIVDDHEPQRWAALSAARDAAYALLPNITFRQATPQ